MQTRKTHNLGITAHIPQKIPGTDSIQNEFKIKGNKEQIDVQRLKEDPIVTAKQEIQALPRNGFTCSQIEHFPNVHLALKNKAGPRLAGRAPWWQPHKPHGLGGQEPCSPSLLKQQFLLRCPSQQPPSLSDDLTVKAASAARRCPAPRPLARDPQNCPGWQGPRKIIHSHLPWERQPRCD